MNSDLKRMCEAAWKAEVDGGFCCDPGGDSFDTSHAATRACTEAIVRAVLTEPLNVEGGSRYDAGGWSRATVTQLVADIFAEPATEPSHA